MPPDLGTIMQAASAGFTLADAELINSRERQVRTVFRKNASGTGHISLGFSLDQKFRLVYVRAHFSGAGGYNPLHLSVESSVGSAYNTRLFTVMQAGTTKDVHLRISDADTQEPSPWTFQTGDQLRIDWQSPDPLNITWGLEVGLALVS